MKTTKKCEVNEIFYVSFRYNGKDYVNKQVYSEKYLSQSSELVRREHSFNVARAWLKLNNLLEENGKICNVKLYDKDMNIIFAS